MIEHDRDAVIGADTVLKGNLLNGRQVEIYGYVEGELIVENLIIHDGGRLFGTARADTAEIRGLLQGEVAVKNLITIGASGTVIGKVQYGNIQMENGGNLSAELRNVPPELTGDFQLVVGRGRSVVVTPVDITAVDPDDEASALMFRISNIVNGQIILSSATATDPVSQFTQADLEAGKVSFLHDGRTDAPAAFDVVVSDDDGATSGAAQTVKVAVRASP